ncbi:MAG: hypothetical protein C0483_10080 [Pirellula sp.]|nr:hypothetical protein [Pirellula sp.]
MRNHERLFHHGDSREEPAMHVNQGDGPATDMPAVENGEAIQSRLLRGGLWVILGRTSSVGVLFIVRLLFARTLTPASFGDLMEIIALISALAIIARGGLNQLLIRLLAENGIRSHRASALAIVNSALSALAKLSLFVSVAVALLWFFLVDTFFPGSDVTTLPIAILIGANVGLLAWHQVCGEGLRGLHEMRWATAFAGPSGGPLLNFVLVVLLCLALTFGISVSLSGVFFVQTFALAILLPIGVVVFQSTARDQDKNRATDFAMPAARPFKGWMIASLPILAPELLGQLQLAVDLWLAGFLLSPNEVGVYAAGRQVSQIATIPINLSALILVSSIPELLAQGKQRQLSQLLQRVAVVTGALAGAVLIALLCAGPWAMSLLFGPSYADGYGAAVALCAGQLMVALAGPGTTALMVSGHEKFALKSIVASIALQLLLTPIAASAGGIVGIAAVSSLVVTIRALASNLYLRYVLGVFCSATISELRTIVRSITYVIAGYPVRSV